MSNAVLLFSQDVIMINKERVDVDKVPTPFKDESLDVIVTQDDRIQGRSEVRILISIDCWGHRVHSSDMHEVS